MKIILSAAAIVMALSGAAFAQQTNSTAGEASGHTASDRQNSLSDPTMMTPFYTDGTMGTMKSADEMKSAWSAMSAEDQARVKEDCKGNTAEQHTTFCESIGQM